jgi:transposase
MRRAQKQFTEIGLLVEKGTRITGDFPTFLKKSIDTAPNSVDSIGSFYGVKAKKPPASVDYLSDFSKWDQKSKAKKWLLSPANPGKKLPLTRQPFPR